MQRVPIRGGSRPSDPVSTAVHGAGLLPHAVQSPLRDQCEVADARAGCHSGHVFTADTNRTHRGSCNTRSFCATFPCSRGSSGK